MKASLRKMPVINPWLMAAGLLFMGHQLTQKVLGLYLPLADSYLDPFLCAPLLLSGLLAERQWLFGKGAAYRLSLPELALASLLLVLISEWLFPKISAHFTADPLDMVSILAGTLFFQFTLNRPASKPQE